MSAIQQILLASATPFLVTLNTATDVNLRTAALSQGWDGSSNVIATIPAGQTLSASSTVQLAILISGSFPSGVTLINSGTINGAVGGGGGGGINAGNGIDGSIGGNALQATVPCTVINTGVINCGGGGQGGGAAVRTGGTSGTIPTSPLCGLNAGCLIRPTCSDGFCNTNTGPTGANGTLGGGTGANGTAGSSAGPFGTQAGCGFSFGNSCNGTGTCDGRETCFTGSPGIGGAAGAAIVGSANISLSGSGTINGSQVP
jgi:hypothetical protein